MLDSGFKIAIGGGDDAHVGAAQLGVADRVELARLQRAQQLDLILQRHFADLVEKQGAGLGQREPAGPVGVGAGKRAAHVAEELAGKKLFGEAPAVHGDERALAALAALVDRAGEQLLARAGFAAQQQRHVGHCHLLYGAHGSLHRRAALDDLAQGVAVLQLVVQLAVLTGELDPIQGPVDEQPQMIDVHRFCHEVVGTVAHRLDCGRDRAVGRQQDRLRFRVALADLGQKLHPGRARHAQVEENQVVLACREHLPRLVAVGGQVDREAGLLQCFLEALADEDLVVGDQDVAGQFAHEPVWGRRKVTVVPWPAALSNSTAPPCWFTIRWAMERPRPVPESLVV